MNTVASSETETDFLIIGAGIAGASVAYWLAQSGKKVVLLEREQLPGYHSTGRSAALYMESYGSAQVRALSTASRPFFDNPPAGFADYPLLTPRGAMMVSDAEHMPVLEEYWKVLQSLDPANRRLTADEACALVPALNKDSIAAAVIEPSAADMDVDGIHQGFLRGMRRAGGQLVCDAEVTKIEREVSGHWKVTAGAQVFRANVVINSAGAWGDVIGELAGLKPLGLEPRRRSAMVFAAPEEHDSEKWPMVHSADEGWYIKPDAGMVLASPANADPTHPHDVQPEELDIALAIHRLEECTRFRIRRPERTWAGLRTFSPDGDLVGGFDPDAPGFFWLVAQGGYGIQTSAAMGEACAALAQGLQIPKHIADCRLTSAMLSPQRLRTA